MAFNLEWNYTGEVFFNVSYPSRTSDVLPLTLNSPAGISSTQEILTNVKLYITGKDSSLILGWASLSSQDNLNGGLEVSFNSGRDWTRFTATSGNSADSSTWITLSGDAISSLAADGVINPYDSAKIMLRLVIPPSFSDYRVISFNLGVDFDVI